MSGGQPEQSWVLVERSDDMISGSIHREGQAPQPFSGWLELVTLLTPDEPTADSTSGEQ